MSAQTNLSYTETFADIANWTFNTTPADGTFTAGIGATAWKGQDASGSGTVPNPLRITTVTTAFQTPPSGNNGYSGGIYRGTQNLVFLSTGTSDNTTSTVMDLYLNFSTVNAGTLSFDWASLNNSTGNRNGSFRVYATVDGVSFTEITAAAVLNFTNNSPTSGSVNNVSLPSIFNGSYNARLRFYYHNGTGGTTGSRPRLSIDNVKITALPTTPCVAPTAQPTNFIAGTPSNIAIPFSFTAPTTAPQNYLIVQSFNNALSGGPINNTTYNIGDNLGDGIVIGTTNNTNFTATGLAASTTYHFFIFSVNNACTGGPLYYTTNPLHGNATTAAGALPCVAPSAQPSNLVLTSTTNSISGTFNSLTNVDEYLIIRTTTATFTGSINNGTTYSGGMVIGNGTVVNRTSGNSFTANNLASGTTYYFFVFALNNQNCTNAPAYNTTNPLTGSISTVALPACSTPLQQPTNLNLSGSNTSINGYFQPSATADGYLVVRTITTTLSALPTNGTNYTIGNNLGNGTIISNSSNTSFIDYNLSTGTIYYYFVFARNANCTGTSPTYLTNTPLTASFTTTTLATTNYYFGNLHAHSAYSDGNVDNTTLTPADNYAYAKNSLCMDFLGISEHNHSDAGMNVSKWNPGLTQAAAATTTNFLALYGMEWGVISNGGHVLIYGSNNLLGWESGNYNQYVAKSDYIGTPETTGTTGLFRTLNNLGNNSFATFAHPSFSDYNNLSNIGYNSSADSAVVGAAVASGVAFSTNTTYSDAPASYGYFDFYQKMLSKGYHIGPLMDHDTHYTNFGRSSNNRLAILMPSLTSSNFYTAMRNMNFYASEDCDTRVNFTLNNQPMGSILAGIQQPAISVYAVDPTNSTAIPTIRLFYGIAGSGNYAVQVASSTGYTLNYTDITLPTGAQAYYYADITIAGNRTVTAPIWYTKNTAVPVSLQSFTASITANRQVLLQWSVSQTINLQAYEVEKGIDGVHFQTMQTIAASSLSKYQAIDLQPSQGLNYYRIKMLDKDGSYRYSTIAAVNLQSNTSNAFSIYPIPAKNWVMLQLQSTTATKASCIITDMLGRTLQTTPIALQAGSQSHWLNIQQLPAGHYQITLHYHQQKITQKLIVQ